MISAREPDSAVAGLFDEEAKNDDVSLPAGGPNDKDSMIITDTYLI